MASVTAGENAVTVGANLPKKGETAPEFHLTGKNLKDVALRDLAGNRKLLKLAAPK